MVGQPNYPSTRRKFRRRRNTGGSPAEGPDTRIWRDYIEGILSWDDRCRFAKLYGSGTVKRRESHALQARHH
jgi:hypothetical protein